MTVICPSVVHLDPRAASVIKRVVVRVVGTSFHILSVWSTFDTSTSLA